MAHVLYGEPVLTLGIDLATEPKKTGTCLIKWGRRTARVEFVNTGSTDDDLARAMANSDWVGIDAPFAWPIAFVSAIAGYAERRV
jgi:predicted nuclease with RNAse H fold